MEHRIGSRVKFNAIVELWCGETKTGNFQAHDISHGGLFIQDGLSSVSPGNLIEVRIAAEVFGNKNPFHLRAFVVRQSQSGTGLMWAGRDPEFHDELNRLRSESLYVDN